MAGETEYRESFPMLADIKYRVALFYTSRNYGKIASPIDRDSLYYHPVRARWEEEKFCENLSEKCHNHARVFPLRIILRKEIIPESGRERGTKCGESDINPFDVRCYDSNPPKCYEKFAWRIIFRHLWNHNCPRFAPASPTTATLA